MKKSKNAKKTIRNVAIAFVSVAIVLVVLYGIGYSTGFVQRAIPALKVGDHKINALEYRFYYTDAKQNLIDEYGDAMKENGVDFNKPLESQNYTEDQSWSEYIHNIAVQNLTEIYGDHRPHYAFRVLCYGRGDRGLSQQLYRLDSFFL